MKTSELFALAAIMIFVFSFAVHADFDETSTVITDTELQAINQTFSSPGTTPDNFMYGFKRFGEGLQKFFTFDQKERAKLNLQLAKLRLSEAKLMMERGHLEYITGLIDDYNNELNEADENTPLGQNISEIIKQANLTLPKSQIVLEMIRARAPQSAWPGLERAINNSIIKNIRIQEKLHAKINETMEQFENRTNTTIIQGVFENIERHKMRIANMAEKKDDMLGRGLERLDELIADAQEKNQTNRLQAYEAIQTRLENRIISLGNKTGIKIEKLAELQEKIRSGLHTNEAENETD